MDKISILKKFINNNNGILLTSDLKGLGIQRQYIKMLLDEEYIEKVEKGVYVKKGKLLNDFYLMQQRYKTGIFSHNTALYFYHLTDRTPLKYDFTFRSNVRVSENLIVAHYIDNSKYDIGLTQIELADMTHIKIYDLERTIIDILRDRNKIDTQIFNQALNGYVKRKDKNLVKLSKYAKEFKIENVLKKYMEVLM